MAKLDSHVGGSSPSKEIVCSPWSMGLIESHLKKKLFSKGGVVNFLLLLRVFFFFFFSEFQFMMSTSIVLRYDLKLLDK